MSGFLKNFDRIICNSKFTKPQNNYIVRTYLQSFAPAQLYYNPAETLQAGHGKDVFELAITSYALHKQNVQSEEALKSLDADNEIYSELSNNLERNQHYIRRALEDIHLQFKSNVAQAPLAALTQYTFLLGQSNQQQNKQIFQQFVQPEILQKISYASVQDIIDLSQGLVSLKIFDKQIWEQISAVAQNKQFNLETVFYHGWDFTNYETRTSQGSNFYRQIMKSGEEFRQNTAQSGQSGFVQGLIGKYYDLQSFAWYRIVAPFFFRESRAYQTLPEFDIAAEAEVLISDLKQVEGQIPSAKNLITQLQKAV